MHRKLFWVIIFWILVPLNARAQEPKPDLDRNSWQVRYLDAMVMGGWKVSADGRYAVVRETDIEPTNELKLEIAQEKIALWNLDEGRVVRFLDLDGIAPAKLDGYTMVDHRFAISQDGSKIAAIVGFYSSNGIADQVVIWDANSGQILHRISNGLRHSHNCFFFVDNQRIAVEVLTQPGHRLELIDTKSGQVTYPYMMDRTELYGGYSVGDLVYGSTFRGYLEIELETGKGTKFKSMPKDDTYVASPNCWYSPTENQHFVLRDDQTKGFVLQSWDHKTKAYQGEIAIGKMTDGGFDINNGTFAAFSASTGDLNITDLPKKMRSVTLRIPKLAGFAFLEAVSANGCRVVMADNRQLCVIDCGAEFVAGDYQLDKLVAEAKKKPQR